ncbi:hypothetical protein P7K49_036605 [Saguinus oedipus]|uniref:Uncharacterized protein n=1 Tax=Saguinus oedipus TaxID=9490 RepID=A0ABQ9TL51_SAGOE|nr:hypothetical protein P7K49_036605 [Saguinus oedipus]
MWPSVAEDRLQAVGDMMWSADLPGRGGGPLFERSTPDPLSERKSRGSTGATCVGPLGTVGGVEGPETDREWTSRTGVRPAGGSALGDNSGRAGRPLVAALRDAAALRTSVAGPSDFYSLPGRSRRLVA